MTLPLSVESAWPAAFLAAVPLLFWLAHRSRTRLGRRHLLVATILRSLAIVSLALALMRPQWNGQSGDVSVIYALDVSRSVSSSFIDAAIKWIERADKEGRPAHARYLAFADHAILLQKPADIRNLTVTGASTRSAAADAGVIDQTATNLEQALDAALMGLDPDRAQRIVLLTDGNQTAGDVWRMLPRLTRANVRVYPIPAKGREDNDAWIEGIEAPAEAHSGEPVTVTVRVVTAVETTAQVSLKAANTVLGAREVQLKSGLNRVAFEAKLARAGSMTLSAGVIAKGDPISENNRMQKSIWVNARPRILYIEGGPAGDTHYLADALGGQGIDTQVIAPAALPASASELAAYDAVILSDTSAKALASDGMQAIESYVRDLGGGVLFASGENVYGEQGYSDTAVEKVLPVQFRAQEKRKDLALVIALDRSYSMKGRKMEMAKEATRAALDLLEEQHRFGVVAFDSQTCKRRCETSLDEVPASCRRITRWPLT